MRAFPKIIAAAALGMTIGNAAEASSIVYRPANPAFEPGNPNAISSLLNSAVRPAAPAVAVPRLDASTLVQDAVLSQISTNIVNQIFNNSNSAGSFDLGGGSSISFYRSGGYLYISVNGTTIVLPDV